MSKGRCLDNACSPQHLLQLAGRPAYDRGERYAAERRVSQLSVNDDAVVATVVGSERYRVRLRLDGAAELVASCTCPVEGFCKHCVAVGLAVNAGASATDVRSYLATRPHEELVGLVLDALERDPVLGDRLALAMGNADGFDVRATEAAIDAAAVVPDFLRWDEVWTYVERLDGVLDTLESRVGEGGAADVVALVERLIGAVEAQLGAVDDSSGAVGDVLARAATLHVTACMAAAPDPVALAERLFALELGSDHELFVDAFETYASVLGETGSARFAELADATWDQVDGIPPWRLARIMERLAGGDVDRIVAIRSRELDSGWRYLEIAELLLGAGRAADALEWAERGLAAHPDQRLRDFLAERYQAAGRPEDALAQRAAQFDELPSLAAYQALHAEAEPLGAWATQRAAALERLRRDRVVRPSRWHPDRSVLVAILLWEGDVPGAWEEAQAGGCSRELWRRLARERVGERPDDAIGVYRMLLDRTIDRKNDSAYEEAIELLAELHGLLAPTGHEDAHSELVSEVRRTHGRKRNLIRRLDVQEWPARRP